MALALLSCIPSAAQGQVEPSDSAVWVNAGGGNWSDPANWLNGEIPGPDDIAVIELEGDYTIALDTDVTVSRLRMDASSGTQTLNVNGRTLTVQDGATLNSQALLQLSSGTAN